MFKKLKKKAFTLVELLVVIAILAILASVSVVGYLGFTENARKSKAVTELTQYKTMLLGELASGSATLDNGTEDVATDDVTLTMIEQGKIEVAKKGDTDVKVVLNKFFGARDNSINVKYDTNDTNLIIYIDYTTDDNATASWNISTDEVVAGASTGGSETDPSEPTDPEEPGDKVEVVYDLTSSMENDNQIKGDITKYFISDNDIIESVIASDLGVFQSKSYNGLRVMGQDKNGGYSGKVDFTLSTTFTVELIEIEFSFWSGDTEINYVINDGEQHKLTVSESNIVTHSINSNIISFVVPSMGNGVKNRPIINKIKFIGISN